MGTRLWLCALKEDTVQLLIKEPARIEATIERIAKPPAVRSISPFVRLLARLIERRRATTEGDNMDIDKAWHGLHYLMTGTAWAGDPPLNFILAGGIEIEHDDGTTARLYSSSQVRQIHRALKCVDRLQLQPAYNPLTMTRLQIYPDIWERDAHAFEYCMDHLAALKNFVARADQGGFGMVTVLS